MVWAYLHIFCSVYGVCLRNLSLLARKGRLMFIDHFMLVLPDAVSSFLVLLCAFSWGSPTSDVLRAGKQANIAEMLFLKGLSPKKIKLSHHFLLLMKTCSKSIFCLPRNTKRDIKLNVHAALFHTVKVKQSLKAGFKNNLKVKGTHCKPYTHDLGWVNDYKINVFVWTIPFISSI